MAKLKELKRGQKMPTDFWNYNVNPIVGWKFTISTKHNKHKK